MIYSRRCKILGPIKSDPGITVGSWQYLLLKYCWWRQKENPWAVSIEEVRIC